MEERRHKIPLKLKQEPDVPRSFSETFISPNPDAYALRIIPTTILMTLLTSGAVLLFASGNAILALVGLVLAFVANDAYLNLSTKSRIRHSGGKTTGK